MTGGEKSIPQLTGLKPSALRLEATQAAKRGVHQALVLARKYRVRDPWEERFFAALVLGKIAAAEPSALKALSAWGDESDWRVNEALAMAFDEYCEAMGYADALPVIRRWLRAKSPSLRRAVSEGLRPWIAQKRTPFAEDPQLAIDLLGTLKDDPVRSVQESVGNALRDISRKHPTLVGAAVEEWLQERPDSVARRVIAKHSRRR